MTKDKFLQELNKSLKRLSERERADILHDYEEHFTFGLEEGKTEEEIAESLGSPTQIAKELFVDYHLEKATRSTTIGNVFRAFWAVVGLGFFNLVIVLGPAIGVAGIIFAGWAVGVSLVASPLVVIVNALLYPSSFLAFNLFVSLACCGIGYFVLIVMFIVTKLAGRGLIGYLNFNVSLVKGGLKHEK